MTCPRPCADAWNWPCVTSCGDSRAVVYPPPVVVNFPGPILASCPQESIVGTVLPRPSGDIGPFPYGYGGGYGSVSSYGFGGGYRSGSDYGSGSCYGSVSSRSTGIAQLSNHCSSSILLVTEVGLSPLQKDVTVTQLPVPSAL
ncbi:hypothetical protein Y1Q_0005902 [Alligator mississippiensis]|uniref:Keratin n=1 Tax=Alligator mississippiensis TaxID=8496 RepID=A0A151M7K3_ALLMI|nr:hypothetical protein Y1Q_0005902 [Alligator mississippiensis]